MKTFALLITLIFSVANTPSVTTIANYNFLDALEKNLITSEVNGNEDSPHYIQPIVITLTNTSAKTIKVTIPNGQLFTSAAVQDVIVTQKELITLAPGESKSLPLYAMCIQQNESGSNAMETYTPGNIATGHLAELAQEIEDRKDFNTLGQYSIWAITDGVHLNTISGFDEEEALYLRTYTADLLNVPVPEYDPNDYLTNYHDNGLINRSATGKFKFYFSSESAVTIAMFDENDIVVRELYNNPNTPKGKHDLEFKFDVEVYRDKVYYVRLIQDGKIQINMTMKPQGS
ncbi:MAG: hypothetical protein AAF489_04815 [Bacteroidota bacterium]